MDGFDVVVRFNDFRAEGFESYVGSRTHWWARNELPEIAPRAERFERILLRPRMECPDEYGRTADETAAELRAAHPDTPIELVDRAVYLDLKDGYGFRNAPLTGTLVAAHLLRRHLRVWICGFDGLRGPEDALRHYYSDENVVGDWTDYHDPDLDARYLRERADEGRLVVL